jgi:hypothetical protein
MKIMRSDVFEEAEFQLILDHEIFLNSCAILRPIVIPITASD